MLTIVIVVLFFPIYIKMLLKATANLRKEGKRKLEDWVECEGTIIGFTRRGAIRTRHKTEITYDTIVEYYVNGIRYVYQAHYWESLTFVGNKMTVLYNPQNPAEAVLKNEAKNMPLLTAMAVIFLTIPFIIIVVWLSKISLTLYKLVLSFF